MRTFALIILLAATLAPMAGAELSPDVLKRAKARIDALLGNRRGAAPTPVNPANPFLLPETAPVARDPGTIVTVEAPPAKSDILTRLAAMLNVSGYIQIQGVPHLIINRLPYRENDLIPVRDAGGSVTFLHLKKITSGDFTLELDDVELLQKHTVK